MFKTHAGLIAGGKALHMYLKVQQMSCILFASQILDQSNVTTTLGCKKAFVMS